MSQDTINIVLGVVLGFLASISTTIVNNHFQDKRERNMRWWERKVDAYSRIIESLYQLTDYYDSRFGAYVGEIVLSEENKVELEKTFSSYNNEIVKAAKIGAYIISKKAVKILNDYFRKYSGSEYLDEFEYLDTACSAAKDCLKQMTLCANSDLKINE